MFHFSSQQNYVKKSSFFYLNTNKLLPDMLGMCEINKTA